MQNFPSRQRSEFGENSLSIVYAQYLRSEPFSPAIFEGFTSLRVLTYSASIPMIVKMLAQFDTVDCIFGYEGVLHDLSVILACQKDICEQLLTEIKGLDDGRKRFILEKVHQGKARFFVVKDAIAHSKIYLLEGDNKRRVLVGSANLSIRAFSGKQAETLIIFDNNEPAWNYYQHLYSVARQGATNEISQDTLTREEITLEDIPLLREAQQSKTGITVFLNTDTTTATIPRIIHTVEKLAVRYKTPQTLPKLKNGQIQITPEVVGKIVQLVRSQKREDLAQEPTWFSIHQDTRKVLLSGKEISLSPNWADVQSDVQYLIEYFENFQHGFHGDVAQQQKDYFLFMCWLYLSPFVCDLRNRALVEDAGYILDFPLFAVLYGKSNCGKTRLLETLVKSMFGQYAFVDKSHFTRSHLRDLLYTSKRFPIVFDDVDKVRFTQHAPDIIKDETIMLEEYPAFVLSMNAEDHSFSTEIHKRCLILYTKASLPDYTEAARALDKRVRFLQLKISTALYREYLRRILDRFVTEPLLPDMLKFSSEILTSIFTEATASPLPVWCTVISMNEYQGRKYEKIRAELLKLYETNPKLWQIGRNEIILRLQLFEAVGLRKDIPDWVLKEGSKAGNIVLDRKHLEDFLGISFKPRWLRFFRR
jgi:hypothetical protein